MKNIGNKITNMKESIKGIVGKYMPSHKKPTTSEEAFDECPESNYGGTYEDREVNQSFMG